MVTWLKHQDASWIATDCRVRERWVVYHTEASPGIRDAADAILPGNDLLPNLATVVAQREGRHCFGLGHLPSSVQWVEQETRGPSAPSYRSHAPFRRLQKAGHVSGLQPRYRRQVRPRSLDIHHGPMHGVHHHDLEDLGEDLFESSRTCPSAPDGLSLILC